jgi:hypothetical protein
VAWIFIILAGFAMLTSILQNVILAAVFSGEQMKEAMDEARAQDIPPVFIFFLSHFRLLAFALLVGTTAAFVSAVGLLLRKNWARIIFIVIMGAGIVSNLLGVVVQFTVLSSIPQIPDAEVRGRFDLMFGMAQFFNVLVALGMSVLFGWIIWKLVSPSVRDEFLRET